MLLTPFKFLILRVFNFTLGRVPLFSAMLKEIMIRVFVKKGKFTAASKYFNIEELNV